MASVSGETLGGPSQGETVATSTVDQQGIVAGLLGAATIALWFLLLDSLSGRPLYTPTVLGIWVFRHGEGLASPDTLAPSFEMAMLFTWIHALVFLGIGFAVSRLLRVAERHPNLGFGILLLFVVFESGFVVLTMTVAQDVVSALAWPAVLIGNLLAAAAMGAYFWRHHPNLRIEP
jgi:hypothetical protein